MSDRIVHTIEVVADSITGRRQLNQSASPMRYILTVNRHNNIIHGAARPEDQVHRESPLQGEARRSIVLDVEEDSDEAGPASRPMRYTATVDEHDIIVHGAALSRDRAKVSAPLRHHATSSLILHGPSPSRRHTAARSTSEAEGSDSTAEGEVNTRTYGSTRGIAERVKTRNTYISRRQNSAITRPGPDAEGKYIVEVLLAQIRNPDDPSDPMILVKWEGYGKEEATWEPRSALLEDAPAEVRKFDARQAKLSDERSLSPLHPQTWPTGLSETAFRDLDVASPGGIAASPPKTSASVVVSVKDTDSEDDDAPIRPRRGSKTVTSSPMRSSIQPKSAALQRARVHSTESLFDGPAPDISFWTASPEPQTIAPPSLVRPKPNRETPGMFVTPGREPMPAARKIATSPTKQPARARLGEGYSVPEDTRTNQIQSHARTGLGYAGLGLVRSNFGDGACSATLTPALKSNTTIFQPDHTRLPSQNKRKGMPTTKPIISKRPMNFRTRDT